MKQLSEWDKIYCFHKTLCVRDEELLCDVLKYAEFERGG